MRWRLATGVPITTSDWPLRRDSSTDQPASKVMNNVVPRCCDSLRKPDTNPADNRTGTIPPA